jgi:hypothetical protein
MLATAQLGLSALIAVLQAPVWQSGKAVPLLPVQAALVHIQLS